MSIDKNLLEILRCPESRGELLYFSGADVDGEEEFLFCPKSKLRYRIDQGIPVMLVDDAERLDDEACADLEAKASARALG